jgi:hypothetical protein
MHNPGTMGPEFYKQLMHVTTPVDMTNFIGHYSSDDVRVREEMVHDPLGRNKLSALELLGTFNFIQQGSVLAHQVPRSLPTLMIQGKEDQIINANSSVKLFSNLPCTDKNMLMIPDCGHILIGTSFVKPVVEEAIVNWLAMHGGIQVKVSRTMPPSAPPIHRVSGINPESWSFGASPEQAATELRSREPRIQLPAESSGGNLPAYEPAASSNANPVADPIASPIANPVLNPIANPIADPVTNANPTAVPEIEKQLAPELRQPISP